MILNKHSNDMPNMLCFVNSHMKLGKRSRSPDLKSKIRLLFVNVILFFKYTTCISETQALDEMIYIHINFSFITY